MSDYRIEEIAPPGVHEKVLEIALALPGTVFLDVPTGYGALTNKLLASGKQVTAGDIDIGKFKAERDHRCLKLVRLDLNEVSLPLSDNQFDIAISVEGIEHLQSQWSFVRNLYRVLKPEGYFILTTPNILNIGSRIRYFIEGRYEHFKRPLVKDKSWIHDLQNYHIAPVSFFELQFILESCGFSIVKIASNRLVWRNLITQIAKPLFRLFYQSKNSRDKKRNRGDLKDLYQAILSDEVFYGECLIIVAKKN